MAYGRQETEDEIAVSPPLAVIVDDDYDVLEWARVVFEAAGFLVECFFDGESAYSFICARNPDVVVTDLMMANLDSGFDFARRIKGTPGLADTPVILMTAASSRHGFDFAPRDEGDLAAMQVDAFFSKPADPQALIAKARALLPRHR